jgi:CRP-like cAMP-binding protein
MLRKLKNTGMPASHLSDFLQTYIAAPKAVLDEIAAQFDATLIPEQEYFLRAGRPGNQYLFLETGFMRAFTLDVNGNEITTGFYQSGRVVFEPASFFNHTPSKESIQALTDCAGFVIDFERLNHLFHSIPAFREFGRAMLVKGYAALKQRTLSLIHETAEERYAAFIAGSPEIFRYARLKDIATYLGITDSSLSRIRREFTKK